LRIDVVLTIGPVEQSVTINSDVPLLKSEPRNSGKSSTIGESLNFR